MSGRNNKLPDVNTNAKDPAKWKKFRRQMTSNNVKHVDLPDRNERYLDYELSNDKSVRCKLAEEFFLHEHCRTSRR